MTMLRKYRMGYGYEQQRLAERVHVSPGYLCDLEHGLKKPSPTLAKAIADVFGVKVTAIFPDGCAEKVCRKWFDEPTPLPALEEDTLVPCPSLFRVRCWRCGTRLVFATPGQVRKHAQYECPWCTAEFMVAESTLDKPTAQAIPPKVGHWHKYYRQEARV